MEKTKYCQSCGMPLTDEMNLYGTNEDGTPQKDYCIYCFKDGHFTDDMTMEQMIDFCVPIMVKENANMTEAQAKQMMLEFFPTLKRWKKA